MTVGDQTALRLAEMVGVFSLATDLGMGQPLGHAQRACLLAMRLAQTLSLEADQLREVYYVSLLRCAGCVADVDTLVAYFGDEIAVSPHLLLAASGRPRDLLDVLWRRAAFGRNPLVRLRLTARALQAAPKVVTAVTRASCEVAERLGERLEVDPNVRTALLAAFERWDGKGYPNHLQGASIPLSARLATLAHDCVGARHLLGEDGAVRLARERAGHAYDPDLVERFTASAHDLLGEIEESSVWTQALAAEPEPHPACSDVSLDSALRALADFTDLKSHYTVGHSTGVARLAQDAARRYGLPAGSVRLTYQAGLVHDLGRVAASLVTWDRPGPLSEREWEQVRLHPSDTERLLAHPSALATLAEVAAHHHERLDGSGYPRGAKASELSTVARILAAADAYHAMTEPRAHRPPRPPAEAAAILRTEAHQGLFDGDAVGAVLAAASHRGQTAGPSILAGLSEPEVEVLRLLARGRSSREIAHRLSMTEKRVHHHVQQIYDKLAVSTRPAATLLALQHELL